MSRGYPRGGGDAVEQTRRLISFAQTAAPSAARRPGCALEPHHLASRAVNGARALSGSSRAPALVVAALTVLAAALRLSTIGRSLWLDEAWRANVALAPTGDAFWSQVLGSGGGSIGAPMPPLFALALRAVGAIVGHSTAGMRALPVLASVAAVPLAYVVGRRAAGTTAGLVAALAFAASPTALLHGQELKQYSTDVLVVLLLLLATVRVSGLAAADGDGRAAPRDTDPSSGIDWIVLAVAMSLAPGIAYPTALVLPGVALATLACCRNGADRRRWLAAMAVSSAAAIAWYVAVIGPQRDRPLVAAYWAAEFLPQDGGAGEASAAAVSGVAASAGWIGRQLLDFLGYCSLQPAWLAVLVALAGLALVERWIAVAALTTLATLIVAAALRVYPLAGGRTTVFFLPFLYLAIAAAAGGGRRNLLPAVRAVLALAASVVVVPMVVAGLRAPAAGVVYEEVAPLLATLDAKRQPNDRVYVYDGAVQAFRFHHPADDPAITLGGSHRDDPSRYVAELRPLLVPGQRLWILFSHVHAPPHGRPERDVVLADVGLYARQLEVDEAPGGASLHLFEVTKSPSEVRHLTLTPEDMKNPERLKELLGR